jgi:hypothetical protein
MFGRQAMQNMTGSTAQGRIPRLLVSICFCLFVGGKAFSARRRGDWFRVGLSSAPPPDQHDGTSTVREIQEELSYSCSYPRLRIDFTSLKNTEQAFLWPWQRSLARQELQRKCNGTFIWIDQGFGGSSATDIDVPVMAFLWRLAANTTLSASSGCQRSVTVAFPEVKNARVVRCWVDMMDWLITLCSADDHSIKVAYSASVENIPTITLTVPSSGKPTSKVSDYLDDASSWPSHETITARTKSWVQRVLVNLGICPFTKSVKLSGQGLADAGVPVGLIAYHSSKASPSTSEHGNSISIAGMCELQADTWEAIQAMLQAGPDARTGGISSILLAAPAFDTNFTLWSGPVFCLLEAGVIAASATDAIGVVCFHPRYQTPDGSSFPGFGHMHSVPRLQAWLKDYFRSQESLPQQLASSVEAVAAAGGAWQRRTPHATINVLRADQLSVAENQRSTTDLYVKNILQLQSVGWDVLQQKLQEERQL